MYTGSPELLKQLKGRRILVGVSGGIAAYKVASVVSTLAQADVEVDVAMTEAACEFITPLTFQALSGKPVYTSVWDQHEQSDPQHIRLASKLDAVLVAPCTMNMLAKLASGHTDDAVSLLLSAISRVDTPVLIAPSMNDAMWSQPATQRNLATLESDGYQVIAPGEGWQACRTVGTGRLPEPDELVEALGRSIS